MHPYIPTTYMYIQISLYMSLTILLACNIQRCYNVLCMSDLSHLLTTLPGTHMKGNNLSASRALPTHDMYCLLMAFSQWHSVQEQTFYLDLTDAQMSVSSHVYKTSNAAQPNTVPPSSTRSTSAFAEVNTST